MDLPLLSASSLALTLTFYVIPDGFDLTADEVGKLWLLVRISLSHSISLTLCPSGQQQMAQFLHIVPRGYTLMNRI